LEAAVTLTQVTQLMCDTASPPPHFNVSLTVLPPKGTAQNDNERVIRSPEDTRPLSLKNSDNKVCTSIINRRLSIAAAEWAHKAQRGFVVGRQGLQNIVDIDTKARIADMVANISKSLPLLVLFDFAAAFPSVAHAWLFLCLQAARLPQLIINYVLALYTANVGYILVEGQLQFFFNFLSGVLQGCPASGSLFVFALNPFWSCCIGSFPLPGKFVEPSLTPLDGAGLCSLPQARICLV